MNLDLRETLKVCSEILSQLLDGKPSEEILSNIDLSDEYLRQMMEGMNAVVDKPLAFVSSEDDSWFGHLVHIVERTDEFIERWGEDDDYDVTRLAFLQDEG